MDQQPTTTPGVRLPQPSLEPMVAQPVSSQPQPLQYAPQPAAAPMPVAPQAINLAPAPQPAVAAPSTADDGDAQDEEWVAKAKDIIATYKNDPHAQSKALSQLRTEYLSKQHNMTVKIGAK